MIINMAALARNLRSSYKSFLTVSNYSKRAISSSIVHKDHHHLPADKITHTGQVFEEKDFRRARFVDKQKEVNENFSQALINEVPPIEVSQRVVSCDGGGGALGHPKVYINLDRDGPQSCGYCGLRFVQEGH